MGNALFAVPKVNALKEVLLSEMMEFNRIWVCKAICKTWKGLSVPALGMKNADFIQVAEQRMGLKSPGNNLLERLSITIIGSITWCNAELSPSPKGSKPPQGVITLSWAPSPPLPSPALAEVSWCPTSPLPGYTILMNIFHNQSNI